MLTRLARILRAISPELYDHAEGYNPAADALPKFPSISTSDPPSPSAYPESRISKYEHYKKRLAPLQMLELNLMQKLADPEDKHSPMEPTHLPANLLAVWDKLQSAKSAHSGGLQGWWEDPDDPGHVLSQCASTMSEMWRDPMVKKILAEKQLRLEESSGL